MVRAAALHPRETPHPSCRGARLAPTECDKVGATHLATRRLRVCLIVIGQIPPSFFCKGMSVAPKKIG